MMTDKQTNVIYLGDAHSIFPGWLFEITANAAADHGLTHHCLENLDCHGIPNLKKIIITTSLSLKFAKHSSLTP